MMPPSNPWTMPQSTQLLPSRLPSLDGVRALSIFAVLFGHLAATGCVLAGMRARLHANALI
jgi:peptidoglycan/LPS O-acetylase OafA/YrhL